MKMCDVDDWKLLNSVSELLSRDISTRIQETQVDINLPIKLRIKNQFKNTAGVSELLSRDNNTRIQETQVDINLPIKLRIKNQFKNTAAVKKMIGKKKNLSSSPRNVIPVIPQALKNRILETGGRLDTVTFVIQKQLFDSDVNPNLSRLSLPYRKARMDFLQSNEIEGTQATLIEPCLEECEISLRNWKSNSMYALVTSWNEVRVRNKLEKGTEIQLWSFRRNSGLCFGLAVIP